jgi:hypothetical protein
MVTVASAGAKAKLKARVFKKWVKVAWVLGLNLDLHLALAPTRTNSETDRHSLWCTTAHAHAQNRSCGCSTTLSSCFTSWLRYSPPIWLNSSLIGRFTHSPTPPPEGDLQPPDFLFTVVGWWMRWVMQSAQQTFAHFEEMRRMNATSPLDPRRLQGHAPEYLEALAQARSPCIPFLRTTPFPQVDFLRSDDDDGDGDVRVCTRMSPAGPGEW